MTNPGENNILSLRPAQRACGGIADPHQNYQDLIVILGPTAAGKTAAAVALAEMLAGEIINADSMQVYRGLDIGTAKPTREERARIPFHLLDIVEPDVQLTVADWKQRAEEATVEIRSRQHIPIVCGGTGLYIRALLDGWTLAATAANPSVRAMLRAKACSLGSQALHAELDTVDPAAAARLHPNDAVRIIRALEVYHTTGVPISHHQDRDRQTRRRPARQFGLSVPRTLLYERIERRVDAMIVSGLKQEVDRLMKEGYSSELGSMRSLGYKEMIQHIRGELTLEEAVAAIKQSTRRYSKRQLTWFRADKTIEWMDASALDSATVASQIIERLRCSTDLSETE